MAAGAAAAATQAPRAKRGIDPRWFSSSLLTLILVIGQWRFQILGDSYVPWICALGTALLAEIVLFKLHSGGFPNLLSAYISGNSVAILLKPSREVLWPFVVCSLLAIGSKYVLRYKGRHLWNPTNFSVCVLLLLAPGAVSILSHQWGNDPAMVAIIWAVGLLTVIRARVVHLTLGYLVFFVVLAWFRTLFNHQPLRSELGPVTGPMYQLFMFFMVTDPRTIVKGMRPQMIVIALVALCECALRLACDFDAIPSGSPLCAAPPMFALWVVGPLCLWLQLRNAPAPAPKPAPKTA
jgi:Na+-translocating ferredoxin:NAD+ oxidoreductase RnfD subunit